MSCIYKKQTLKEQTFFQKLWGSYPKENFIPELTNFLHENELNLKSITKEQIKEIRKKYKVKRHEYTKEQEELYNIYLRYCLEDAKLSDEELETLENLKSILKVTDTTSQQMLKKESENAYKNKFASIISDAKITAKEQKELEEIEQNLDIDKSTKDKITNKELDKKIKPFIDSLIEKERISPDDEIALNKLSKDLNVAINIPEDLFEYLKELWVIENSELVELKTSLNLQKSEKLYYQTEVGWYEDRKTKGSEMLTLIDRGTLYLTSKRIIFMGNKGNKTSTYKNYLSYTEYSDSIRLNKTSGKSPLIECNEPEKLAIYFTKCSSLD